MYKISLRTVDEGKFTIFKKKLALAVRGLLFLSVDPKVCYFAKLVA